MTLSLTIGRFGGVHWLWLPKIRMIQITIGWFGIRAYPKDFDEILACYVSEEDAAVKAASKICQIYYEIAAEFMPEEEIHKKRDEMLSRLAQPKEAPSG